MLDKGMCEKCDAHVLMWVAMDYILKHSTTTTLMNQQQIKHHKRNTTRYHSFKDQTISHSSNIQELNGAYLL